MAITRTGEQRDTQSVATWGTDRELQETVAFLSKMSGWMDAAFTVPGTRFRVGWDGIIGLIPGVGDVLGLAPLAYYLRTAYKFRLGKRVYFSLIWNQLIDSAVGTIPLVGDLFDFVFKANLKNSKLLIWKLEREAERRYAVRSA